MSRTIAAQSSAEQVEAVVREHARFVYHVAYAVLGHPQEAEDAAQETFIRVWKHAKELPGILNQRAWLARITWRIANDRRKKYSRPVVPEDALPELADRRAGAEAEMLRSQETELLKRMIAMLPADLRDTLALSTVQEMTSAEIAATLGIAESSVRGRLLRARQLLREKVQALMERRPKQGANQ